MSETIDYTAPPELMTGRIVLVTGATSGIGHSVALSLAEHGATVVALGRSRAKLASLCEAIEALPAPAPMAVEADLEKMTWDDYLKLASGLRERFGRLDGLLHNAALLGERAPLAHYDPMTWHRVMHVNVSAAFLLTRALLPLLTESEDATVVFTSSGVGRQGKAYWGAYSVSKFASEGLMEVLADEMDNTNVRVNALNPGKTRTNMRASAYPGEDPATLPAPEAHLPSYLYLLGPASKGVNGKSFDAQPSPAAR